MEAGAGDRANVSPLSPHAVLMPIKSPHMANNLLLLPPFQLSLAGRLCVSNYTRKRSQSQRESEREGHVLVIMELNCTQEPSVLFIYFFSLVTQPCMHPHPFSFNHRSGVEHPSLLSLRGRDYSECKVHQKSLQEDR